MNVVVSQQSDRVATVTLNRPEVLNAMNATVRRELTRTLDALDADPSVRVIVLQGAGRAFCAGQDQKESSQFDAAGAAQRIADYAALFDRMRRMETPVIARLHGYAVGAGLQLALLADLRIAADTTTVGMTELNVSSPCITGSTILRATVGDAVMRRLVLYADFVPAPEALRLGLVHEVVAADQLEERVAVIAGELAGKPATAVRLTKAWWCAMTEDLFAEGMRRAQQAHAENFAQGELTRGAQRFLGRK